ncbi:MAG: tetratricopeptide repeat protein, partial [Promethearchaeota archaeon]
NHPNEYPDYISTSKFSERYDIKKTTLEYYIDEIVENQIYPIKFFKLEVPPDKNYYFQSDEKIEMMLQVITKEHITKFTYLNKLFENSSNFFHRLDMESTVTAIVEEICQTIFNEELEESLRIFLPNYINYLAYKIEKKRRLIGIRDKLEGIIWQNIPYMFQSKNIDSLKDQYEDQINEIDKLIKQNPDKIDNYYSKIRILMYFDQYEDVIKLLDRMLNSFPDEESDLQIKKAYILKEQRNVEAGLEIIDELITKYPEDNSLLLHRAYWLQYLDRGEEALEIISNLLEQEPENSLYLDTFGELFMNYEDYGKAIQNFQKAIKIGRNSWYIYQTYIKLGICYKELENFGLAVEYLQKGKEFTKQASNDQDSKQEWKAIADLFLKEIEHLETEF